MKLPDFLIIGAMKAGTTSLYKDLSTHPQVNFGKDKEPELLTTEDLGGLTSVYSEFYLNATDDQRCGEASTAYAKLPDVVRIPQRARQLLGPDLKIIYMVREPFARSQSHHHHLLARRLVGLSFEDALSAFPSIVDYSLYGMQLLAWQEYFPTRQIRVVRFEDYVDRPMLVLNGLLEFLDLDVNLVVPGKAENVSVKARPVVGGWEPIRDSPIYQKVIRPALSPTIRKNIKRVVLSKPKGFPQDPLPETKMHLSSIFQEDSKLLASILGTVCPVW